MSWLGQVIIYAYFEPDHFIIKLSFGSEHQNGCTDSGWILPQSTCHLVAVHIWHHHIEQDQIRILLKGFIQTLLPIGGSANLIALALKHQPYESQCVQVIVDDENFFTHNAFFLV